VARAAVICFVPALAARLCFAADPLPTFSLPRSQGLSCQPFSLAGGVHPLVGMLIESPTDAPYNRGEVAGRSVDDLP
jgi:hypothetical protein